MEVTLNPKPVNLYSNSGQEPQYVTAIRRNKAVIYLDSQDCALELDKTNLQMSTIKTVGEYPSTLAYGIRRIALNSVGINYVTPNVNPRNNTIVFYSTNSGITHTVNLVEGFYTSSAVLIDHIVTQLNTVTGASGLTFSWVAIPKFPDCYTLSCVGGSYHFILTCSAIVNGYQMYNLPTDQTDTASKKVGYMGLYYTRYIDVCSPTLTKYLKVRSNSTGKNNNLFVRVFCDDGTKPHIIAFYQAPTVEYNFISDEPISSVQFELRDQFGELLYLPSIAEGTSSGFYWDCNIIVGV